MSQFNQIYVFIEEFKRFPYYDRGVELLKGYEPAIEKLGDKDKLKFQEIEITDTFNYNDGSIGRVIFLPKFINYFTSRLYQN